MKPQTIIQELSTVSIPDEHQSTHLPKIPIWKKYLINSINCLDGTWTKRFLQEAKELDLDSNSIIEKVVPELEASVISGPTIATCFIMFQFGLLRCWNDEIHILIIYSILTKADVLLTAKQINKHSNGGDNARVVDSVQTTPEKLTKVNLERKEQPKSPTPSNGETYLLA
ncbi:6605_t:CDS:2 [Funneliformis caledonium]|uniref:6605_t:CDS:1 n=1 Tax=Funneliformis caledonium TaxID=1117310 RepID=A0A9N9DM92_9GLOM|nr:6605_t:CDS:2 [Funneliformis caledonium]